MPRPQPPWHPVAGGYDVNGHLVQQPTGGNSWTFVQDKQVVREQHSNVTFVERPDVPVEPDPAEKLKAMTEVAHHVHEQDEFFVEATSPGPESLRPPGLHASPSLETETGTQVGIAERHEPEYFPAQVAFGFEATLVAALAIKAGVEAGQVVKDTFFPKTADAPAPPQPEPSKPEPPPPAPPPAPPQAAQGTAPIPQGPSPSFGSF